MKNLVVLLALVATTSLAQTPANSGSQAAETTQPPAKMRWIEHEFMMPVRGAPQGIDVLQVEVERPGKHPLAILTHGTAAERTDRATVTPWLFLPQAIWFARRGYVVLIVVRKGYGRSFGEQDEKFGGCQSRGSFVEAGEDSADDLRAAAKYAEEKLPWLIEQSKCLNEAGGCGAKSFTAEVAKAEAVCPYLCLFRRRRSSGRSSSSSAGLVAELCQVRCHQEECWVPAGRSERR
jgi:hypothetical protein